MALDFIVYFFCRTMISNPVKDLKKVEKYDF